MTTTDVPGIGRGVHVALLGLDGSGKTTVARGLVDRLAAQGHKPKFMRWHDILDQVDRGDFPYVTVRQLLVEIWRTRYGGATDAHSLRVQHGPPSYEDFKRARLDPGPVYPVDAHRSGMVASAMLEFVTEMLIHTEVVEKYLSSGRIVVRDGFAYRNAMKVLQVANEIPRDDIPDDFIARAIEFVSETCSSPFLQPDVGVFMKVAPEECYRRIVARGGVGPFEDMGFTGKAGPSSFIELQGALHEEYERAATKWGWHIVDINECSPAEALDAVAEIAIAHVGSLQRTTEP
ncbi:hypothetical protein [Mangrovihabitans endophyticus]|uniref:Thymidylate kinase n=1 Tax=Mangrovihabitans endophyticus TaxID=1751298 RepID=A0A8J3BVC5_9ACTN|nr:hypothetical protein [Mangrovihabitans endophyticus]GGK72815.1 hypothetical protein GCM10012284_03430 [Mangrovihabitans endophyticus]